MAVTVSVYNHTTRLFAEGSINEADSFKVMLCTSAAFNASDTTLASISKTEVSADGYTAGGGALTNVVVSTVAPNDAKFDADDVTWTAGATTDIAASYGILYADSITGDPPLVFIDFGEEEAAGPTTQFKIIWNADGIVLFTV